MEYEDANISVMAGKEKQTQLTSGMGNEFFIERFQLTAMRFGHK
jgi:hypothetical protein